MRNCSNCGNQIEKARLDASKGKATTCIKCMHSNDVAKVAGFPVISGKNTYTELDIVDQETFKDLYHKQERKGQSPGNGMRGT